MDMENLPTGMIELVTFLGNPGKEYERNRHNTGWLFAEKLPFFPSLNWQGKFKGHYAALEGNRLTAYQAAPACGEPAIVANAVPEKIVFLKPDTFMNFSGDSVHAAASFFKIPPERILIVHDELELPLGTAAFKFSGGLGGHNGLRSMKAVFGTADFWRLRFGIGRPTQGDVYHWVLSDFSADDEPVLNQVFAVTGEALIRALLQGPESLLPEWNKKKISPA
jgi:PTH1 family peptidyl-tRNA hydrolase